MADALNRQEEFNRRGVEWMKARAQRSIKIGGTTYYGIRTEVTVEPGDAQAAGFRPHRGFMFTIPRAQMAQDPTHGAQVIDDTDGKWKIYSIHSDRIRVTLTIGSVNM